MFPPSVNKTSHQAFHPAPPVSHTDVITAITAFIDKESKAPEIIFFKSINNWQNEVVDMGFSRLKQCGHPS